MTPLDLDALKQEYGSVRSMHVGDARGWCVICPERLPCAEILTADDVLALADEVERLRALRRYPHHERLAEQLEAAQKEIEYRKDQARHFYDHVKRMEKQFGLRACYPDIDFDADQPPAPPEELKADVWTVGPPLTYEQAKAWCDAQGLPAPAPPDPGRQSADGDPEGYGDPAPPSQKDEKEYPDWVEKSCRRECCEGVVVELFGYQVYHGLRGEIGRRDVPWAIRNAVEQFKKRAPETCAPRALRQGPDGLETKESIPQVPRPAAPEVDK